MGGRYVRRKNAGILRQNEKCWDFSKDGKGWYELEMVSEERKKTIGILRKNIKEKIKP
jgi:hypothetical protein